MSTVWRLRVDGPITGLRAAGDTLGQLDPCPALGWSVFEFEDDPERGYIEVLFAERIDEDAFLEHLALVDDHFACHFAPLPDEDWVAMSLEGLPSVEAGRFLVFGAHTKSDLKPGQIGLEIEAGPAFGTGHHGTTRGCLEALDKLAQGGFEPKTILDLGTGTGLLAITAAKLWPQSEILATDIDPLSVDETRDNAEKNETDFECVTADGFDHSVFANRNFDLVIANILAGPLVQLSEEIARRTVPSGKIVLSGLLEEQAERVIAAYTDQNVEMIAHSTIENWATLVLQKP